MKLFILPSWTFSEEQCIIWNKMKPNNSNIELVFQEPCDFYVVINNTNYPVEKKKTIFLNMEPFLFNNNFLDSYITIFPPQKLNNIEWHIKYTYEELKILKFKKDKELSAILSSKYFDEGHKKRIDLCKLIEYKNEFDIDIYGSNYFNWKKYKSSLPYHQKEIGLESYKYHINFENHQIKNYLTEKLIDGILCECLVFYWGCPNVCDFLPLNSFIYLNENSLEENYNKIKFCISNNYYEKYYSNILKAKEIILEKLQFFKRIEYFKDIKEE